MKIGGQEIGEPPGFARLHRLIAHEEQAADANQLGDLP
jgi:hypothetical protein